MLGWGESYATQVQGDWDCKACNEDRQSGRKESKIGKHFKTWKEDYAREENNPTETIMKLKKKRRGQTRCTLKGGGEARP